MPAVRSRTMGIKVTDEEYEKMEAEATARGQTMSDWGREVLLNQIGEPSGHSVVLAEVMALRAIVTNVMNCSGPGREHDAGADGRSDPLRGYLTILARTPLAI